MSWSDNLVLVEDGNSQPGNRSYRLPYRVGPRNTLGLGFLLAGDIIRTVVIVPTLEQVAVLAVIVVIRTFLNFSLQLEIEGRWPWQKV